MGNPPVPSQPPASSLNTAELENSTTEELKIKANAHFTAAQHPGHIGNDEHLLQAQIYLAEIGHRDDARIARRDFRLEIIVILLIGLEIIVAGIEGWKQGKVLDNMAESTKKTASAMGDAAEALKTLRDDQKLLLTAQGTANTNLQDNLKQTSAMATALQKQLKIIESEQSARLAQAAKKPKFQVTINGKSLSTPNLPVIARDQTETSQTYDVVVTNVGDATAHNGTFRISTDAKDVQMIASGTNRLNPVTESKDVEGAVYVTPFNYLREGIHFTLPITLTFPKGKQPFAVIFSVDVDELDAGTMLGALMVNPSGGLNTTPHP